MDIPKGALLGGVYAYLDAKDRMVLVDVPSACSVWPTVATDAISVLRSALI